MKPKKPDPIPNPDWIDPEHAHLMTLREVAKYLGLHYLTVYRLIQEGKIPAARLGGRWRFKKEILDRWIENDMNGRMANRKRKAA